MRCDNLDRGTLLVKHTYTYSVFCPICVTLGYKCGPLTAFLEIIHNSHQKERGEEGVFKLYLALFPDLILPCHQSFGSIHYIIFYHKKPRKTNEDRVFLCSKKCTWFVYYKSFIIRNIFHSKLSSFDVKLFADYCINPVAIYMFKANYKDNKSRYTRGVFKTQSNIYDRAKMNFLQKQFRKKLYLRCLTGL